MKIKFLLLAFLLVVICPRSLRAQGPCQTLSFNDFEGSSDSTPVTPSLLTASAHGFPAGSWSVISTASQMQFSLTTGSHPLSVPTGVLCGDGKSYPGNVGSLGIKEIGNGASAQQMSRFVLSSASSTTFSASVWFCSDLPNTDLSNTDIFEIRSTTADYVNIQFQGNGVARRLVQETSGGSGVTSQVGYSTGTGCGPGGTGWILLMLQYNNVPGGHHFMAVFDRNGIQLGNTSSLNTSGTATNPDGIIIGRQSANLGQTLNSHNYWDSLQISTAGTFPLPRAINSVDCQAASVNTAIGLARANDTVVVPSCPSTTWSTAVNLPSGVNLQGATACPGTPPVTCTDNTIISTATPSAPSLLAGSGNTSNIISGFTFNITNSDGNNGAIFLTGNAFRFHHNHLSYPGSITAVVVKNTHTAQQLADHNLFDEGGADHAFDVYGDGSTNGYVSWNTALSLGTLTGLVVEDSTFNLASANINDDTVDCYAGGRYVVRHNQFNGLSVGNHGTDSNPSRSCFSIEEYQNIFTNNKSFQLRELTLRGGTAMVWGNTFNGSAAWSQVALQIFRAATQVLPIGNWQHCDGTNWTLTSLNGNINSTSGTVFWVPGSLDTQTTTPTSAFFDGNPNGNSGAGSACRDQPGRTHNQALAPVYEWLNNADHGIGPVFVQSGYLVGNHDYYAPVSPFTGATGIGNGLLSARPATCTPGVAYWVTDASPQRLDQCGPTANTWTSYYTPLVYPHPFQNAPAVTVFYVNNSGTPACADIPANGTLAAPWCTFVYGQTHIASGNTLFVHTGTYNETPQISGPAGTAQNPTIISAYPGDSPILNGPGINNGRVKILNTSFMTFTGFEVRNYNQGIFVETADHIAVTNNTVHDNGQEQIHVHFGSTFFTVSGNTIFNSGAFGSNGEGIYIGSGDSAPVDQTGNGTVSSNTIHDVVDEGIEIKIGTHDVTVDGNTLTRVNTSSNAFGGAGIEINNAVGSVQNWPSNPNHIVTNNTVSVVGNGTGGVSMNSGIRLGTGVTAYNNVVFGINSAGDGIYTNNFSGDSYPRNVYHNTVDLVSARAIVNSGGTVDIRNNIGPATTNNIATNNAFYVNQAGSDYHLVASSLPINAGVNLGGVAAIDKNGVTRTNPPDLGAYEFVGGAPGPPVASLSVSSMTFAAQNTNTTSATQTLTITNTGGANLVFSGPTDVTGDFAASTSNCLDTTPVAPLGTCSFSVTFTPCQPLLQNGIITISDNSGGFPSQQQVSLTGQGIGATSKQCSKGLNINVRP